MGSRLTASGTERVYAAARLWVDRALRTDDSLFTPGYSNLVEPVACGNPPAVPGQAGRVGRPLPSKS